MSDRKRVMKQSEKSAQSPEFKSEESYRKFLAGDRVCFTEAFWPNDRIKGYEVKLVAGKRNTGRKYESN